jgi:hypothetical protein
MATKAEERAARKASIDRSVAADTKRKKSKARKKTLRDAKARGGAALDTAKQKAVTLGNEAPGKIREAFTSAKEGTAKAAKKVRDFAGAAKTGTTTRAQKVAEKLGLRGAKAAPPPPSGPATLSPGSTGQVSANKQLITTKNQLSTNVIKPAGALKTATKLGLKAAPFVGLAADVATTPTDQVVSRLVRQNPLTAGPAAIAGFGLRKQRGEGTFDALKATARDVISPNSLGFVDPSGNDPLLATGAPRQSLLDRGLGAAGLGPTQSDLDTFGAEDAASTAAQATGAGLPTPTQQATLRDAGVQLEPGRGVGPGGAPAAQFGVEGERAFTNPDAQAAAAGIDPQSRRGTASLEENQAVMDRLLARNQGLRAQQFAGSQAAPGVGRQAEGSAAATRLAQQASGGGLASAFGALALSGNQLRRQAAERGREFAASETAADAKNTIQNTLAGQSARFQALDQASRNRVTDDLQSFAKTLNGFRDDPVATERFLDSTFAQAINDPGNVAAQVFAQQETAKEIRGLAGRGFFEAISFSTERGLIDWVQSWGQGGQAEPLLLADGQSFMTINPETGMLEILSPDGSTRQVLDNPRDMSPRVQEFLKSIAPQASGRSVGPPQGHPKNLRDLQLRQ